MAASESHEPLPMSVASEEETAEAMRLFQEAASDFDNPFSTAVTFVNAIRDLGGPDDSTLRNQVLPQLVANPADFGDYQEIVEMLGTLSLAMGVAYSSERDDLAYVKMFDTADQNVRMFDDAELPPDGVVLNLVRPSPEGLWLVWGVSRGDGVPASGIFRQ